MNTEKKACLDLLTGPGPHKGKYAFVPLEVLLNVWNLTPSARDVLLALLALDRGNNSLQVSIRTLARISHRSRNTVSPAVRELEAAVLIRVKRAAMARGRAIDRSEYDLRPFWSRVVEWRTVVTNPEVQAEEKDVFQMLGVDQQGGLQ